MSGDLNLSRFVDAQGGGVYSRVLAEMRSGRKKSHWMWFVFPQLKGLGTSGVSDYYGLADLESARDYLAHPVLGKRLREITQVLLELDESDPEKIFGFPDCLKFRSCMTLFNLAEPCSVFEKALEKFHDGQPDVKTLELLEKANHESEI